MSAITNNIVPYNKDTLLDDIKSSIDNVFAMQSIYLNAGTPSPHNSEIYEKIKAKLLLSNSLYQDKFIPKYPYAELPPTEYNLMLDLALDIISACPENDTSSSFFKRQRFIHIGEGYSIKVDCLNNDKLQHMKPTLEFQRIDSNSNIEVINVIDKRTGNIPDIHQRINEAFTFKEDDPEFPAIERVQLFFEKYESFTFFKDREKYEGLCDGQYDIESYRSLLQSDIEPLKYISLTKNRVSSKNMNKPIITLSSYV